jgi:NET1-associated nuclear protein 1 (U3 small nucleolar RNA-associated protein 17)
MNSKFDQCSNEKFVSNGRNRHLILPTKSHIHVYSTRTSLLVRSLFVSLVDPVTSCIICGPDSEHILVSTLGGKIIKFNWVTGKKSQQWKAQSGLIRIYGLWATEPTDDGYHILAMNQSSEGERGLSHFTLHQSSDVPMREVVVRSKQRMAATVATVNDGRLLIASSGDKLMLGSSQDSPTGDYTWREFTVPGKIVSFDARSRQASNVTTKTRSAVDVALGLQDGAILIYDDVVGRLIGQEKGVKGSDMVARRLHWHRELVSSVKWSRDGTLS